MSKPQCAICERKIGAISQMPLADAVICGKCTKKAAIAPLHSNKYTFEVVKERVLLYANISMQARYDQVKSENDRWNEIAQEEFEEQRQRDARAAQRKWEQSQGFIFEDKKQSQIDKWRERIHDSVPFPGEHPNSEKFESAFEKVFGLCDKYEAWCGQTTEGDCFYRHFEDIRDEIDQEYSDGLAYFSKN